MDLGEYCCKLFFSFQNSDVLTSVCLGELPHYFVDSVQCCNLFSVQ